MGRGQEAVYQLLKKGSQEIKRQGGTRKGNTLEKVMFLALLGIQQRTEMLLSARTSGKHANICSRKLGVLCLPKHKICKRPAQRGRLAQLSHLPRHVQTQAHGHTPATSHAPRPASCPSVRDAPGPGGKEIGTAGTDSACAQGLATPPALPFGGLRPGPLPSSQGGAKGRLRPAPAAAPACPRTRGLPAGARRGLQGALGSRRAGGLRPSRGRLSQAGAFPTREGAGCEAGASPPDGDFGGTPFRHRCLLGAPVCGVGHAGLESQNHRTV